MGEATRPAGNALCCWPAGVESWGDAAGCCCAVGDASTGRLLTSPSGDVAASTALAWRGDGAALGLGAEPAFSRAAVCRAAAAACAGAAVGVWRTAAACAGAGAGSAGGFASPLALAAGTVSSACRGDASGLLAPKSGVAGCGGEPLLLEAEVASGGVGCGTDEGSTSL